MTSNKRYKNAKHGFQEILINPLCSDVSGLKNKSLTWFYRGVGWADENPNDSRKDYQTININRICMWLEKNISKYTNSIGGDVNTTELTYDLKEYVDNLYHIDKKEIDLQ